MIDNIKDAAKTAEADGVTFDDGETFQEKYNSGELKGGRGDRGEQGPAGPGANEIVVALPVSGWSNGAQTVQNAGLVVSGYGYIITPDPDSYGAYTSAVIYADSVTTEGQITFHCEETPTEALKVSLMKIKVEG